MQVTLPHTSPVLHSPDTHASDGYHNIYQQNAEWILVLKHQPDGDPDSPVPKRESLLTSTRVYTCIGRVLGMPVWAWYAQEPRHATHQIIDMRIWRR